MAWVFLRLELVPKRLSLQALRYVAWLIFLVLPLLVRAEPVTIRFASWAPTTTYDMQNAVLPYIEAVNRDLEGVAVLKHYPAGILGDGRTMFDSVRNGTADIGYIVGSSARNVFIKTSVTGVPFLYSTSEEGSVALWRLYEKGVIASDYQGFKLLAVAVYPPATIQSTRPVNSLEDLNGMRIRVSSRPQARTVQYLGGVPVWLGLGDIYQGLEKGLVQAAWVAWTGAAIMKLHEVTTYHVAVSVNGSSGLIVMNGNSWNRLTPEIQEALERHGGVGFARRLGAAAADTVVSIREYVEGLPGHVVSELTGPELQRWREAAQPFADEWAAAVPDGARVIEEFRREVEAVRHDL